MTAKLITHEPDNNRTFEVTEAGLTIGRHADNQASLDDSRLSRFHAKIEFRDGAWYAVDLGSTNGSFINDKRFQGEVKVNPGDKLRFGATDAELVWTDVSKDATPPPVVEPKKTSIIPEPPEAKEPAPDTASLKTAATIVAPLSSLIKQEPASAPAQSPIKALKVTPLKPAAAPAEAAPVKHVVLTPISPASAAAPAPAVTPVKPLVITPASPEEIAALDGLTPVEPAAAAPSSPLKPAVTPGIRKPVVGGGLRPGLKLPPKAPGLKSGLKLPPKPTGLKPGIKLPPKTGFQLKPGLKLPPKPGAAPAQ